MHSVNDRHQPGLLPLVRLISRSEDFADVDTAGEAGHQTFVDESGVSASVQLSAPQKELAELMRQLGMRRQDFAAALGIGVPRLSSYLYGSTISVPHEVMQSARALAQHQQPGEAALRHRLLGVPMHELVTDWQSRLGAKSQVEMAGLLGVTTMTIQRWKAGKVRPDLTALVRYETLVLRLSNR